MDISYYQCIYSSRKIGAIQLAKEAAKERNVKVRIMIPANSLIEQKITAIKTILLSWQYDRCQIHCTNVRD